jgi:hypothetical protein
MPGEGRMGVVYLAKQETPGVKYRLENRIMTTKAAIEGFMSQQVLAVVGVSRNSHKFGNVAYRELKARGYRVFAVNPNAQPEITRGMTACRPRRSALRLWCS